METITTFKHLKIGDLVVRDLGSSPDNSNGRTGNIVEFDIINQRVRVKWTHERSGKPIIKYRPGGAENCKPTPVRTWVSYLTLKKM